MKDDLDTSDFARPRRVNLASQIESLLARLRPSLSVDRRHDGRIAIPALFRLTPFDAEHQLTASQATIVVGKNISRRGMSFYHEWPMPHRRALIELAHPGLGEFAAEIDVSWCRFTRPGWYESGGRLVRSLTHDVYLQQAGIGGVKFPETALGPTPSDIQYLHECQI